MLPSLFASSELKPPVLEEPPPALPAPIEPDEESVVPVASLEPLCANAPNEASEAVIANVKINLSFMASPDWCDRAGSVGADARGRVRRMEETTAAAASTRSRLCEI